MIIISVILKSKLKCNMSAVPEGLSGGRKPALIGTRRGITFSK